jgi:uncharacterized protein (TIGR00730 family)
MLKTVCVFCGSAAGRNPAYAAAARETGGELVRRGCALVYGGGRVGLMGEVATAAAAAGGPVIGVIPQALSAKEIAYADATELIITDTMHSRKSLMADRADAFLALPGGFGTADELFEILTWAQLGIHRKPVGILNVNGFFTPLLAWLDHIVGEGLLKTQHREVLLVAETVSDLLDKMERYEPPEATMKWILPDER